MVYFVALNLARPLFGQLNSRAIDDFSKEITMFRTVIFTCFLLPTAITIALAQEPGSVDGVSDDTVATTYWDELIRRADEYESARTADGSDTITTPQVQLPALLDTPSERQKESRRRSQRADPLPEDAMGDSPLSSPRFREHSSLFFYGQHSTYQKE
jgi:hypothetical protein